MKTRNSLPEGFMS